MKSLPLFFGAALAAVLGRTTVSHAEVTTGDASLGEVHFAFDSSALPADVAAQLHAVARFACLHPAARIVLDAHTDPIGTEPYNAGLAVRRAESVRSKLTAMGVPPAQIVFAVYGEAGATRPTYADDRRVTVWATSEPLAMVIDRTFDGKGTAVTWGEPLTVAQIDAAPEKVARR